MAAMIGGHHKLTNVRLYLPSSILKSYDFTHTLPLFGNLGRQSHVWLPCWMAQLWC